MTFTKSHYYPAVTKILSKTQSEETKQALANWKARIGEEEASRICEESKNRGLFIHDCIKSTLERQEAMCPEQYSTFWANIEPIIGRVQRPQQIEQPIVHNSLEYQGRLDLLAFWEGNLTIFDFKTSEKTKQKGWLTDAFIQIAAYMGAIEATSNFVIEQGLIVVGTQLESQLFLINKEELNGYWEQWLERLNEYQKLTTKNMVY